MRGMQDPWKIGERRGDTWCKHTQGRRIKIIEGRTETTSHSRGQWLRHWRVQCQLILANTFFKKQDFTSNVPPNKQLQATRLRTHEKGVFKHCKDAVTTGQIDMNSDHKAVTARIELAIKHKTQQIQSSTKMKTRKQSRGGDNKLNWNERGMKPDGVLVYKAAHQGLMQR